ncbi:DNA-3-methyladenine glycosylase III [Balnearium lithotrophicum]|uniref:DNA-3-methyladenine glycosylase III n=1 Tax=Balnearium lithotrophicum TaxID=223788 RepID=A0A521C6C2_9BACT|nr:endonuclease [Balnearium lithotrophicum]SMO54968.1 DNA-3-methyladenine glycosylase III [Balnearium lithotrophicum]
MVNIFEIYQTLFNFYGEQSWWPAQTPFEVCVGAILTQNTNWKNVERAIENLKLLNLLSPEKMVSVNIKTLQAAIKPVGFYRKKALYLKNFSEFLLRKGGLSRLQSLETQELRNELLEIKGIGKETSDSILLYALNKPIFVVDNYTKRLLLRLGLIKNSKISYENLQDIVEKEIKPIKENIKIYKEFHALIVIHCKLKCKKKPLCEECTFSQVCYNKQNS